LFDHANYAGPRTGRIAGGGRPDDWDQRLLLRPLGPSFMEQVPSVMKDP